MWITTGDGSINLDRVQRVSVQSDGSVYLYFDTTNYFNLTTVSNSQATSKAAMQKMLRSIDASQYA